jgi:hypothetical protein
MIQDKKDAINDIEKLEQTYNDLDEKLSDAEEKNDKITDILNQSKSHELLITNFAKNVETRENALIKMQAQIEDYEKTL